ncbi:MAG: hypothetical protein MR380_11645 [Lachnospiraceae bacterium]|nr:hypothetical protein [Lachnospiraceae bacterium]
MERVYWTYWKYLLMVLLVIMAGSLAACGQKKTESATESETESKTTNATEFPVNSILYFNDDEGSTELIQYFEDGNVPEEATALYDQMGSNPEITITDAETIKELYKYLGMIKVHRKTNESITDCYHYVEFKLADDHYIHFSFEGTDIWSYGGKNYSISNSGKLFGLIKELTDKNAFLEDTEIEETPTVQQDESVSLYQEAISGNIRIEYPSGWTAQTSDEKIVMSKDGTENYPFFSVEEIGWVGAPGTFMTNQMDTFKTKYQNRVAMSPEASGIEVAGMKLAGFTASYSSYDGSATITRLEYVEVIDDITYHFVCEYVSDAYGRMSSSMYNSDDSWQIVLYFFYVQDILHMYR